MAAPGQYSSYPGPARLLRDTGDGTYSSLGSAFHGTRDFGGSSSFGAYASAPPIYGSTEPAGSGAGRRSSTIPGGQESIARATELGIGLSSMVAQTVFSHPFVVMRRQCQVNQRCSKYHLTPFTVFQVMVNVQKHQSLGTYWKGLGNKFLAEGVQMVAERVISEATPLPRELNKHTSIRRLGQHLTLKLLGFAVATPFIASSFVDSVRSEIASESSSLLECARMSLTRVISWSATETARMLPIWKIVVPVVVHGLLHYSICSLARYSVWLTSKVEHSAALSDDQKPAIQSLYDAYFPDLVGSFAGSLLADVTLYPLETIVHRLLVQGTRTIIDNTDTGLGVLPINTHYSGFFDCLRSILVQEGAAGLYKGFGALLVQYAVHALILRASHLLYRRVADEWSSPQQAAQLYGQRASMTAGHGDMDGRAARRGEAEYSSSSSQSATTTTISSSSSSSSSNRTAGMSPAPLRPYTEP